MNSKPRVIIVGSGFGGLEAAKKLACKDVHVTVIDRAAAFGSLGPLGSDVRALGISATNVVCGLGGADVTPGLLLEALEWAPGPEAVWA